MTAFGAVRGLILSAVLIALSACGEPTVGPQEPGRISSTSYIGAWRLIEGHGPHGEVALVDGSRITINLEETSLRGTAACNMYAADVAIDGGSFRMRGGGVTDMACRPNVMESERAYLDALHQVDSIARTGDRLTLIGDATELHFAWLPPIPTAELVDTRWELESLRHGTDNDGTVTSAAPAHLIMKSDGTVVGSTGCRDLHGEWTEQGDEILFTTFGAEGNCPKELREQDTHVVGALGDGFTVEIDADRLTVTGRFGIGLGYRAAK